jgi:hypothetical protein
MHNRLIFRYHHVRAHAETRLLRGCPHLREEEGDEPTHLVDASNAGTQEGR